MGLCTGLKIFFKYIEKTMNILVNVQADRIIHCTNAIMMIYVTEIQFNPYLTNGFSHHYQLGESTFIFRGVRSDLIFLSDFSMEFFCANRIAPDGMPRSAASHLGLCCLPMSHKRDAMLK